jgi:hypothetical protein
VLCEHGAGDYKFVIIVSIRKWRICNFFLRRFSGVTRELYRGFQKCSPGVIVAHQRPFSFAQARGSGADLANEQSSDLNRSKWKPVVEHRLGVADGTRTRNNQNHNLGLYH